MGYPFRRIKCLCFKLKAPPRCWKGHEDWWEAVGSACCAIHHPCFGRAVSRIGFTSESSRVMQWCQHTHLFLETQVWGQTRLGTKRCHPPPIKKNPAKARSRWSKGGAKGSRPLNDGNINPPSFSRYIIEWGYLQFCLLSVMALMQPGKRAFVMCRKGLMELDRAPSVG